MLDFELFCSVVVCELLDLESLVELSLTFPSLRFVFEVVELFLVVEFIIFWELTFALWTGCVVVLILLTFSRLTIGEYAQLIKSNVGINVAKMRNNFLFLKFSFAFSFILLPLRICQLLLIYLKLN